MGIASIKIHVSDKIYLRDPEQTQLGRKIINHSIRLIDELGFETFTFKKLAKRINSTEASIYRYFENKHNLLVYIVSWYWSWLEYQVNYQTNNIQDGEKKLKIALKIIVEVEQSEFTFSYINQKALHRIVISESPKSYYTKNVDNENKKNFFRSYKSFCNQISKIMLEIDPSYPYSHTLSSTILESAHQQVYFSQHLPSLTELKVDEEGYDPVLAYLEHLAFTQLKT